MEESVYNILKRTHPEKAEELKKVWEDTLKWIENQDVDNRV